MRISDWSSDVCSSDLHPLFAGGGGRGDQLPGARGAGHRHRDQAGSETRGINGLIVVRRDATHIGIGATAAAGGLAGDRKSVVSGKSGSVRVDLGWRRILKKEMRLYQRV